MMNKDNPRHPDYAKYQYPLLLLILFVGVYILPLGVNDLIVPDETRYAEMAREIVTDGNWIAPRLNGVRYFEKPALGYWIHAGAIWLFGENDFAVRLPSAMAVGLSTILLYFLICRMHTGEDRDRYRLAMLAALIFLTCFLVFGVGGTAVLDNLFAFFLTTAITSFYFASEASPRSSREKQLLVLSGISCGLAFLTKGFLALVIPILVMAPYLLWQRRFFCILRMGWLPILSATLVALPWGILIHLQEPDFWRFFFWNEHIRRFLADNAQHKKSFFYFFMVAPGIVMPWTFMLPIALSGAKEILQAKGAPGRLLRVSICWLVFPFLFFSFSNGKLLTYILPCFPPFAILTAFSISKALNKKSWNRYFNWGLFGNAAFFALALFAFIYVQIFGFAGFRPYSQNWKAVLAVSSLVFVLLFCFWSYKSADKTKKIILFGLSPLMLFVSVHFILPDLTIEKKTPGVLLKRYLQEINRDTIIISDESSVRAVCWYLKRSNVYVLGKKGKELAYGLAHEDAAGRLVSLTSAASLIKQNPGQVLLIAKVKNIIKWRDRLPKPAIQDDSGPHGYAAWSY